MRQQPPEQFRLTVEGARRLGLNSALGSDASLGRNGMFIVPHGRDMLRCLISDGHGWEHVSISVPDRCPTWGEMCFVKDLFWEPEECVIQYHPPRSEYVNNHPFCLHLWKPVGGKIETPPSHLVGIKS